MQTPTLLRGCLLCSLESETHLEKRVSQRDGARGGDFLARKYAALFERCVERPRLDNLAGTAGARELSLHITLILALVGSELGVINLREA